MSLISPFLIEDVKESLAAYCAMPHAQREGFKKPTLAKFRKMHAERHQQAVANAQIVVQAKQETPGDLAQIVATAVANALAVAMGGEPQTAATPVATPTRKPVAKNAIPQDAASNRKLWRLNVEGLLAEALAQSDEQYVTEEAASATLTAAFGPLA